MIAQYASTVGSDYSAHVALEALDPFTLDPN